jgi:hypothetical protein
MLDRPRNHIRDDLKIAVRVHSEPAAGRDLVIVEDAQAAKALLCRIVVIAERKCVPAVEPTEASGAASVGGSNGDHSCSPLRLQ